MFVKFFSPEFFVCGSCINCFTLYIAYTARIMAMWEWLNMIIYSWYNFTSLSQKWVSRLISSSFLSVWEMRNVPTIIA
jgi:hypothetical protein